MDIKFLQFLHIRPTDRQTDFLLEMVKLCSERLKICKSIENRMLKIFANPNFCECFLLMYIEESKNESALSAV